MGKKTEKIAIERIEKPKNNLYLCSRFIKQTKMKKVMVASFIGNFSA